MRRNIPKGYELVLDKTINPKLFGDGSLKDQKIYSKGIYRLQKIKKK